MRQEHQVGPLNNCISELQQEDSAQRLELQDAQHGYHLGGNDYSFDALQAYCFGINIKL